MRKYQKIDLDPERTPWEMLLLDIEEIIAGEPGLHAAWEALDIESRETIMHEIDTAITRFRDVDW